MSEIFEFDPVIYPLKVWVSIGVKNNVLQEFFTDIYGYELRSSDYDSNEKYALCNVVQRKEDNFTQGVHLHFFKKNEMSLKIIAHECSHAADAIFKWIGESDVGTESRSYLVGFIADCCDKVKKGLVK